MKAFLFPLFLLPGLLPAQEVMDMAARRESVKVIQEHLEMRRNRFKEVMDDIRAQSKRTDERISKVVDELAGLKDSETSMRRVSDIKAEAIGSLKGMLNRYADERRTLVERLRTGAGPATEALNKDLDTLDGLMNQRVQDVVKLVQSMPAGQDVEKYETEGSSLYNGVNFESTRISNRWRQSQRDEGASAQRRREVAEALKDSIQDLETRKSSIESVMSQREFTQAQKEVRDEELERIDGILQNRREQLDEVLLPSKTEAEQSVDRKQADDLKNMFADVSRDIANDFNATLRLYNQALDERDRILNLEANLEAREKWLKDHDAEGNPLPSGKTEEAVLVAPEKAPQ